MADILWGLGSLALLAAVCLKTRVGSRFHRGLTRGVCALWALMLCTLLPGWGVGVNALTVACVGWLGLPGLGLLQVVAMMR